MIYKAWHVILHALHGELPVFRWHEPMIWSWPMVILVSLKGKGFQIMYGLYSCATASAGVSYFLTEARRHGGMLLHPPVFSVALMLIESIDRGDVGMIEFRQGLRFTLESGQTFLTPGKGFGQDLDGHFTVELGVGGLIDLAHAALAELRSDLVMCDGGVDHRGRV